MGYFQKNVGISLLIVSIFIFLWSCEQTPLITDEMLDGNILMDSSLLFPEKYLVSLSHSTPSTNELETPIIITCHGYSASTFEWDEFKVWAKDKDYLEKSFLVSQVLLGGHGDNYDNFKQSSWKDWQKSIIQEYEALTTIGYKNIHFAASSTSCPLIIDLLSSSYFNDKNIPKNIFFVDPIIVPSNKHLSLVKIIGPLLGYVETGNTEEEDEYWYHYRPQETLQQLEDLITSMRKKLEDGIILPKNCNLKVYKSIKDESADPVSAVLIYKGIKNDDKSNIEVEMIDSDLHVFTRLKLRKNVTPKDINNQKTAFEEIAKRVSTQ